MQTSIRLDFPKSGRIRCRQDFQKIMDSGIKIVCPHVVFFARKQITESSDDLRLGLVVSRKVGNAVVRNRVKRYLRESFRSLRPNLLSQSTLKGVDLVILARVSTESLGYEDFKVALSQGVRRVERQLGRGHL